MKNITFLLCLMGFASLAFAQNIVISSQNTDNLYVCGTDQLSITLQNSAGPAATNLQVTLSLPPGIRYQAGTVAGASEGNITNLNNPVFALTDLAGAASVTLTLDITADCPVVQAINSGQTFSNTIVATYAGGSKQFVSSFYPVETGLLNISTISPPTATAQKGDVVQRTITMRNTRQGPIQSLIVRDQHFPGITIAFNGANNESNTPTFYQGEIPGSYFTNFGNGNDLFEFDEEITLVELVTIEDCGIPSYTNESLITVGWGCGGPACRIDSVYASITILPTTENPILSFFPLYDAPSSQCGLVPDIQEIIITNNGLLPATNVLLNPFTLDTTFHGIDPNSFLWNDGSGWQNLPGQAGNPTTLSSCDISDYVIDAFVVIPEVLPGESVRLRFNTYFCQPICGELLPRMKVGYNYAKACPANTSNSGSFNFFPDTTILNVTAGVSYNLENCLQDGQTYNLNYSVKSDRLTTDTGFLQVIFDIPLGLDWVASCPFNLDGQTPLSSEITPNGNGSSTIKMVFDLPFSQDSVGDDFCLLYHCEQDMPCESSVPGVPPRGLDYIVFPPASDCDGCQLKLNSNTLISVTPDEPISCAITFCDEFFLVVDNQCDTTGGGGGGGGGLGDLNLVLVGFDAYRTNYGFQDNNDDRMADNSNTANAPGVRRDRFIVGDTLRTELRAFMLQGTLSGLSFRVFLESWLSDLDTLDGDFYTIEEGKMLFANYDTTRFVSANLTIKTAAGQVYSCPIPEPAVFSDQHIIQVAEPNIRPPQIIDVGSNMFQQFSLDFDELCLPQGFELTAGDSLFFTSDYKFTNNFTPNGSNSPPLVNFTSSICDTLKTFSWNLDDFCTANALGQFSGYLETVTPNAQRIEPCAQSTEITPFQYNIRLARGNMFPFELRQLATVTKYSYSLPSTVGLIDTRLNYLTLQENFPLFGSTPIVPSLGGDSLTMDLSPFFSDLLDEGFGFEISTRFDTTCGYNGTQFGRTVLGLQYANTCFHNPVNSTYYIVNPNGYQSGSPNLSIDTQNDILYLPDEDVLLDFFLHNNSPVVAQNVWLSIESDGDLADVQLLLMPGQTPVPQVAGVYQLDSLNVVAQSALRVTARNLSCRTVKLIFRFGWDCDPVFSANANVCGQFTKTVELRPEFPELELVVVNQPAGVPMCSPSAYFEFEVSNANDGTAYNILPSIKLPPGMRIAPGTAQLSYPAGMAYVDMSDPLMLAGNVWQFNPEANSSILAQNGLVSADQSPLNRLRIRFRVIAECGVVANAQPIYGAESLRACGAVSNVLRKPGLPIGLEGVVPSYSAVSNLAFASPPATTDCGQEATLSANIAVNDIPMVGDSIYILLPVGTSYVSGSYVPGVNAPNVIPQVIDQQLLLPLPTNIGSGSILTFTFKIRYNDPADCADKLVILQTREKSEAFCPSNNQLCDIYIATGEALLNINAQNPELQFNNAQLSAQGGQISFQAVLENVGMTNASNPVVEIYHDLNGNGQIDPTDLLLTTVNVAGNIAAGGAQLITGNLNDLPASAFCHLIARIPALENCACEDRIFPLNTQQSVQTSIGLCNVETLTVGIPAVAGSTYEWVTTEGLSCITCSSATYTPGPGVMLGDLVTLVLQERSGDCTIERVFDIQFGGTFGIETDSLALCAGGFVTLQATAGGSAYNWSGPGINNPNQATQLLQPISSAVYMVTVTFNGGCTGTGLVPVTVLPTAQIQLPALTTCAGTPVAILDRVTDIPGVYSLSLQRINGCDSIIMQELIVIPAQVDSTRFFCEGDSTIVLDSLFASSGKICRTEISPITGCETTTCVTVTEVANPELPEQIEPLFLSDEQGVVIETPDDFATYTWTPFSPDILSCSDCPDPIATPDSTMRFTLVVLDGNGCRDTAQYRIFVCDDKKIRIPNAFTPNGDGANDSFRVVPFEGPESIRLLQVYSRWGQKVYEGGGVNAQWDGKIGGLLAPSDVYVWVLDYTCGGEEVRDSGEITLMR